MAGPDINDYGIEQDKGLASLRLEAYRFRPDEPITLGEFSKMVVNGLQIPLSITASHFTDVPRGHPAFKYIETLYDYSTQSEEPFFDFEPSDDFKTALAHPEKHVTSVQATKILSGLLQRDVLSQLEKDADITRGEAAILIHELL